MTKYSQEVWDAVETDYKDGVLDVPEISQRRGPAVRTIKTRARKAGWVYGGKTGGCAAAAVTPAVALPANTAPPAPDRVADLPLLYQKLRAGLERIIDGKAFDHDAKLLGKTGGTIDAFSALAGAQAKLIQLERLTSDQEAETDRAGSVQELARKLRAAQRAMEALTRGPADAAAAENSAADTGEPD
jgi:hypothetical protein